MKLLLLMRHAEAELVAEGGGKMRPLTSSGKLDAETLGAQLRKGMIDPQVALVSTAVRTLETAKSVLGGDKVIEGVDAMYDAGPEVLLECLQGVGDVNVVLMCGHNPGVSIFANLLLKRENISFGTCDAMLISFDVEDWSRAGYGLGQVEAHFPAE